ncbi:MAG: hypothetical protein AAGH88_05500 [Planctomycetota bacterium]
MNEWNAREDEVTGGVTVERCTGTDDEEYLNICPGACFVLANRMSGNVYVDEEDRKFCYLIEFSTLLTGECRLQITKLHWKPGSARSNRFRFDMYQEFEGDAVFQIVGEAKAALLRNESDSQ